jgi:hypothetical protein
VKALSIRQPWAWLIANGHKDIENRSWNTNYRGAFLIHAYYYGVLSVRSACRGAAIMTTKTAPNKKDVVISLFDFTGVMVGPWLRAGYTAYIVDLQHPPGFTPDAGNPRLIRVGADLRYGWTPPSETVGRVAALFAFPECTNVAVSGAKHFLKKGPRALALSLELFATSKELGDALGVPYMIENPVSTFSTYCGKPDHTFNPYEYGGYLPESDRHPRWPDKIAPRDAYPKKTCLWTGGGFAMPEKQPVEVPPGYSAQFLSLGGKSLKTKNIRSATPRGFAEAVYRANAGECK